MGQRNKIVPFEFRCNFIQSFLILFSAFFFLHLMPATVLCFCCPAFFSFEVRHNLYKIYTRATKWIEFEYRAYIRIEKEWEYRFYLFSLSQMPAT